MKVVVKILIIIGVALLNIITLGRFRKMTTKSTTTAGGISASSSDAAKKPLTSTQQVGVLTGVIDTMVKDDIMEDAAYESKISGLEQVLATKKYVSIADVAYLIGQNRSNSPEGDWILAEKIVDKFIK